MRWNFNRKNNGWKTRFAFFPIKINGDWIWLERYAVRTSGVLYTEVQFYQGCAERAGYLCDCYRHGDNQPKNDRV